MILKTLFATCLAFLAVARASAQGDPDPKSKAAYRIVFISNRDGNYGIYAMKADGSDPVRLTQDASRNTSPRVCLKKDK